MYPAARARARPVPLAHGPLSAFLCLSSSLPRAICTSSLSRIVPVRENTSTNTPLATTLVYTYTHIVKKESNDRKKKKKKSRRRLHRDTTRIITYYNHTFPTFSPLRKEEVVEGNWRLEAVFQHAVDGRRNVLEQRFVTGFSDRSSRSPVSSQLSRIIFPGQVIPQRCWTSIFYSQRLVTLRFVPV